MVLTSIRPGDIVRVDKKGRIFLADVTGKEKGTLSIKPHCKNVTWFSASAREVIGHWAKRGKNGS